MYRTSGTPMVSSMAGTTAERGKQSRQSVQALNDRMRRDKIHKRRSDGQRIRQSRERLYGKNSHLVTISYISER